MLCLHEAHTTCGRYAIFAWLQHRYQQMHQWVGRIHFKSLWLCCIKQNCKTKLQNENHKNKNPVLLSRSPGLVELGFRLAFAKPSTSRWMLRNKVHHQLHVLLRHRSHDQNASRLASARARMPLASTALHFQRGLLAHLGTRMSMRTQ
jgi:hypothetical protein